MVNRPHFLTCFFPSHLPQVILAVTRAVVLGWGGVGWDAKASLELDRMVDATQLMGWVWGGVQKHLLNLTAWSMLRN